METTIEAPLETQQIKANGQLKHGMPFFTKENASAYARKSLESRAKRAAEKAAEIAQLRIEAERGREIILADALRNPQVPALEPDEQYRLQRLQRTREQLKRLDEQLEAETDPKCVKSLADAIGRLSDLEFALSGRSKPGLTRPKTPTKSKPESLGPLDGSES